MKWKSFKGGRVSMMTSEIKASIVDIIIFLAGIVLLATGIISFIYADPGSAWPLLPTILSILCFGWIATEISDAIIK